MANRLLRCEECGCFTEDAWDWIARIVYDEKALGPQSYVVSYCPACAELEFDRVPRRLTYT
jgi:hypothetical protein